MPLSIFAQSLSERNRQHTQIISILHVYCVVLVPTQIYAISYRQIIEVYLVEQLSKKQGH